MSSLKDTQSKIIKAEAKVQVRVGETSLVLTMREAEELYNALHSALGKPLTGWTPSDHYLLPNTTRIPYVFPTQKVEVGDRPDLAPTFVCGSDASKVVVSQGSTSSGTVTGNDCLIAGEFATVTPVIFRNPESVEVGGYFRGAKITYVGDDGFEAERVAHDGVNIETIRYGKDGAMTSCRTTCVHVPPKPDPILKSIYDNLRKERNNDGKDRDLAADIFDGSMSV